MKILLVGEYSRLHNSLKEGLLQLGHEVYILGQKDGFKDFPVDFPVIKKWDSGILKKVKVAIYKISNFDITSYCTYRNFIKNKAQFSNFDVVQLINENCFHCTPYFEIKILTHLFKNNAKTFLLSCGDDYLNVKYNFDHPEIKSVLQPYLLGKIKSKEFQGVLKFRKKSFEKLHHFIYQNSQGVIASDMDYHLPLKNNPSYLGLIPNPVNFDKIAFKTLTIDDKIIIFLGINNDNYFKKGSDFYEEALAIIQKKYPNKVAIIKTRSIPYNQYITLYDKAHILLDQIYAYDQGYNALEAMSKGKVVFTGAEKEFMEHYNLTEKVVLNALPDVTYLVEQLSFLIENPDEIIAIGKRARLFIEKEHHYIKVAEKYIRLWGIQ